MPVYSDCWVVKQAKQCRSQTVCRSVVCCIDDCQASKRVALAQHEVSMAQNMAHVPRITQWAVPMNRRQDKYCWYV
jgi:hypothetical protein